MKSFQSNFKDKLDKFSQATEEKLNSVKTAIQKKLQENDNNNNNNNNSNNNNNNDLDDVDNSADLLQGWTLLGGEKNVRGKSIEFNANDLVDDPQIGRENENNENNNNNNINNNNNDIDNNDNNENINNINDSNDNNEKSEKRENDHPLMYADPDGSLHDISLINDINNNYNKDSSDDLKKINNNNNNNTTTTNNNNNNNVDNVNYDSDGEPVRRNNNFMTSSIVNINNNNDYKVKVDNNNNNNKEENAGYFTMLTSAIIWNILSLVEAFDLCQLSQTSAHFFKLATNEFLWERLYMKVFRKNKVDKALWYEQLQHGGYRSLFGTKLCEEQMVKTLRALHNQTPEANAVEWIFKPLVSVQNFFSAAEAKVLMFGLDYSGKTSILYKLAKGEHVKTEHTVGFNHESIEHKGYKFEMWDLEHKPKNAFEFWKTYFTKTSGIIFVIDGTEPARLPQARACLEEFITDPHLQNLPILVFVNKRDVVESMTTLQVLVGLNLHYLCNRSGWHVQPCSTIENDYSLEEGLDWLCGALKHEEVQRLKTKLVNNNSNNNNNNNNA